MATLQHCQYFKIKIDGKELKGTSKREKQKDWNQGYLQSTVNSTWFQDGLHFDPIAISVLKTDDTLKIKEAFATRGNKKVEITIVTLNDHESESAYEMENIECINCLILNCDHVKSEGNSFYHIVFEIREKIKITEYVRDADDGKLKKVGPFGWDFEKKTKL